MPLCRLLEAVEARSISDRFLAKLKSDNDVYDGRSCGTYQSPQKAIKVIA